MKRLKPYGHLSPGATPATLILAMTLSFATVTFATPALPNINTNNIITITNAPYNAVGDGVTTNTIVIQNAINAAAGGGVTNGLSGGTVRIPAPGTYLSGSLALKSAVNLQIDSGATLLFLPENKYPNATGSPAYPIAGTNLTDLEISGSGTIDGNGAGWWSANPPNRPYMIYFSKCRRVLIQDVTLQNPAKMHIVFKNSAGDVTIQRITIDTPESPNTDGMDLIGTNCLVQNCTINAGDDNIALGSSTIGAVCSDILVTNCTFGIGHGVSIGSNTAGGVSNLTVINCTFDGTDYGIRMKSSDKTSGGSGQGGIAQNLSYYNLGMTNIVHGAIVIYSYYGSGGIYGTPTTVTPFIASTQAVDVTTVPIWRNITISNVNATVASGGIAGIIWGRMEVPVTNVVLSHVNITAPKTFDVYNAQDIQFVDSQITVPNGVKTLTIYNAGVTVTNSTSGSGLVTLDGMTSSNSLALYNAQAATTASNVFGANPITLNASTLTISNDLTLPGSAVVNFALGTNLSQVIVVSNLALNGTINVTDGGGFGLGTYTLFTYGQNLIWGPPTLGNTPPDYNYSFKTNIAGQVQLAVVSPPVPPPTLPIIPLGVYNITNYGAVGNGVKDNTTNIQKTINAASAAGGGTVEIPAGTYLSGPLTLASSINLRLDSGALLRMLPYGTYPGSPYTNSSLVADFINGNTLHDIEISGSGAIDGQGTPWWRFTETNSAAVRPVMVTLSACIRVLIQDATFSNSPMQHFAIKGNGGNVIVQRVTITAPASTNPVNPSHNTDAIDLAETNCLIQNCNISVGDDNLAIGSSGSVSKDILVTNCAFGNGHGVSIGSYTSGGVSNLTVINCTFNGTDDGIRLKSQRGRGGVVQNLSYFNLGMTNVQWPILIYSYYQFGEGTLSVATPAFAAYVASTDTVLSASDPGWRNITISNVTATTTGTRPAIMIWGLPESPVSNITLRAVNITASKTCEIFNARGIRFVDSQITLPGASNTFTLYNAQLVVTNSVPSAGLVTLDGLSTNAIGNTLLFYHAQAALKNTNAIDDSPGITLGGSTLTVSNNLNLDSSSVVNFILGTNTSTVAVVSNLTLNNTLNVTGGGGFGPGTYTLFTYGGNMSGDPVLGSIPAGYAYIGLNTNMPGQVRLLVSTTPLSTNVNIKLMSVGGNLVMSGSGGAANGTYYVLTSTNIVLPLDQWTHVTTNQFDGGGHFSFTNHIPTNPPWAFYLLQLP